MKRLWTWLRRAAMALLIIVAIGGATVGWLAFTTSGAQTLLRTAASLSGDLFSYAGASGTLARALELEGVVVTLEGLRIGVDRVSLTWRPGALAAAMAHVEQLTVDGVRVDYVSGPPVERVAAPLELPWITPPLRVRVDRLAVAGIDLRLDDTEVRVDAVEAALRWGPRRLLVDTLAVKLPGHEVSGRVQVNRGDPLALDAALEWAGVVGEFDSTLAMAASGALDALTIEATLKSLATAEVAGTVDVIALVPSFDLVIDVGELALPPGAEPAATLATTRLAVTGNLDAFVAEASSRLALAGQPPRAVSVTAQASRDGGTEMAGAVELSWRAVGDAAGPWPLLAGRGRVRVEGGRVAFEHTSDAPAASRLTGSAPLSPDAGAIDARLELDRIAPPLAAAFVIEGGTVTAAGPIADLVIAGDLALTVPAIGPVATRFDLGVSPEAVDLRQVQADLLDGSVEIGGRIALGEALRADLNYALRRLDAGRIDAALASRIDADGTVTAERNAAGLHADLAVERLAGEWRGQPLSGQLRARLDPGALAVTTARIAAGQNTLTARGGVKERIDGEFTLEVGDLAALLPDATGGLTATGTVAGTPARPVVAATAQARTLRYQAAQVDDLDLVVDLDLASARGSTVTLRAAGLERDGVRIDRVDLAATGTEASHRLEFTVASPEATIETRLRGGASAARDAWSGTLESLRIASVHYGDWTVESSPAIRLSAAGSDVERVCLAQRAARVCLGVQAWSSTQGRASVELAALPLALLQPHLPAGAGLEGTLEGRFDAVQSAAGPSAVGTLEGRATRLTLSIGTTTEVMPIDPLRIDLDLKPDAVVAAVRLQLADWLSADAAFSGGIGADAPLDGRIDVTSRDLAWVSEFVPEIGAGGGLELHGTVGGTATALDVKLTGSLIDGFVLVRDTGLRLDRIELALGSRASQRADVAVRLGAEAGALDITGEVTLDADAGWPTRVKLMGTDFPVVRLPDVEADVSPDLSLEASLSRIDVRGRVVLPRVTVALSTVPASAVRVSSDEVIVHGGGPGVAEEAPAEPDFLAASVTGDIDLVLGEAVTIGGAGLAAKLGGGLRWSKREGELTGRGEGTIAIDEGSYTAYGQNLEVESGALIFAGPIDNPQIDLRAVRPDLDVVAGVRASGSLRSPRLRLFSSPTMGDSEILSYLITGGPIDNASSSDASLITRAALSLGREKSSVVTNQIRDTFRLDELSVNTGDVATDTSFVAGKRLTPRLSVRSDFNPFDQLWSFFLNYKLTRAISVEAESGVRQGADVIYSVERNTLLPETWPDWRLINPLEWFE